MSLAITAYGGGVSKHNGSLVIVPVARLLGDVVIDTVVVIDWY